MARQTPVPVITQDEEAPVEQEILAEAIVRMSRATEKLLESGLNTEAIIALVHEDTKLPKRSISTVLRSLKLLTTRFCRK